MTALLTPEGRTFEPCVDCITEEMLYGSATIEVSDDGSHRHIDPRFASALRAIEAADAEVENVLAEATHEDRMRLGLSTKCFTRHHWLCAGTYRDDDGAQRECRDMCHTPGTRMFRRREDVAQWHKDHAD